MVNKSLKLSGINYVKKAVRMLARLLISALFTAASAISHVLASLSDAVAPFRKENMSYNKTHEFNGFIFDQSIGAAALIKMGLCQGSYNGCGWIAAYNAALIKGFYFRPADIIAFLENHGGILINGLLGVNPMALKSFFVKSGLTAELYFLPDDIDKLLKNAVSGVLMYVHKKGMHFVAVQYKNGMYRVYNEYSGCNIHACLSSVNGWLKEDSRRYFAVSLITIV